MKFLIMLGTLAAFSLIIVLIVNIGKLFVRCSAPECNAKATRFPHGIPCCEEHACDVECSAWLGYDCDCSKKEG